MEFKFMIQNFATFIIIGKSYIQEIMNPHPRFQRNFMEKGFQMILNELEETLAGRNLVVKIKQPEQFHSQISLKLDDEAMPFDKLIQTCKKVLQNSAKPYHPHFHNQLFGGFDQFSALGALMSPLINGSMYTYEIAPVFTLMENEVFDNFRKRLGWNIADGLMTPGGSFGNILAIQIARHKAFPEAKEKGVRDLPPLKIMVANNAHYSMKKGAFLCGLGSESLVLIETNHIGQMIVEDLDKKIKIQIQKGNKPFMVCSLIGSTVEGSIDNVEQISKITKKYNIWHHLDACFGGSIFFSERLRKKVGDCTGVDSVVFDPHKHMLVPLQATIFLCQHQKLMHDANSVDADYLFHKERAYYDKSLDTGNKSLLCGRVIDILKVWTYFKGNGMKGIQQQINRQYDLAQYLVQYLKSNPQKYQLYIPQAMFCNVCFWCLPPKIKEDKKEISEEQYRVRLSKTIVLAKKYMVEEGKMLAGYSSTKGSPYFWRQVMSNPYNTQEQIKTEIQWIYNYCERAYQELYSK